MADAQLGWLKSRVAWTYASATTFTCPGDYTLVFHKGTKLYWTQTTAKYAYVQSVSYSAPNTTVTINGGSSYTVANAAVVSPYYSYADRPQGFPDAFAYTPTWVASTTAPVVGADGTLLGRFRMVGGQVEFDITLTAGTATTFGVGTYGFTLPMTAKTVAGVRWHGESYGYDNSGTAYFGAVSIPSAGTAVTIAGNGGTAIWGWVTPVTWAASDIISVGGRYEAA